MNFNIDKRKTDTKVIDSKLIQYATGDEVIRLVGNPNVGVHATIVKIISDSYKLTEVEYCVYKYLLNFSVANADENGLVEVKELLHYLVDYDGKSPVTYKRAIKVLAVKGIIKRSNGDKHISVNSKFNVNAINSSQAKFIVIDLADV